MTRADRCVLKPALRPRFSLVGWFLPNPTRAPLGKGGAFVAPAQRSSASLYRRLTLASVPSSRATRPCVVAVTVAPHLDVHSDHLAAPVSADPRNRRTTDRP